MENPFSVREIESTIKRLKNNKAPGIINIRAEQIKPSPPIVASIIVKIFNTSVETGNGPKELKIGIITPL